MDKIYSAAVLGSTGYVGLELVNILSKHPNIKINFLGSENSADENISNLDNKLKKYILPKIDLNNNFKTDKSDVVFLALPHGISNKFVKKFFNKIKIIDLSADFRLDKIETYNKDYDDDHCCSNLLNDFIYGLAEINRKKIFKKNNISIPGCYPTSILLPLIPLLEKNMKNNQNIIIDSKSGYSGAGKTFDKKNITNNFDFNFYNYNTNTHRHISEIQQELDKIKGNKVKFSFNPHIMPNFRGMMSTIYCDLSKNINYSDIKKLYMELDKNNHFINFFSEDKRADFFSIQNTNYCIFKIFKHLDESKIIIVSLIDNLIKGAAGQAVQCFNISLGLDETISLK